MTGAYALFERLLHAETEDKVAAALQAAGYLNDNETVWHPLGFENNFSAVGNQQSDPTAALVEKVTNGIDAVLLAQAHAANVDPEGPEAPRSMTEAVARFFNVRDGRITNLTSRQQQELADNIHLVAVGEKATPNYLIIDRGEGQTPANFPNTFLSLMKSNKLKIPFVQGKFNSGGTGILQFCGKRNYQLIVSRRHPDCPVDDNDSTADLWGFTIVRRMLPSQGRRSSVYVYLAPDGVIPSFASPAIRVLPGQSRAKHPAPPYAIDLPYGTCVKLFNYRWRPKSIITTDGRYELEKYLHLPCLPFRVTETRSYNANYYSATVIGGWASATNTGSDGEAAKLEDGFPADSDLWIDGVGNLPYQVAVFKEGTKARHVPHGVFFVVNGQVHGSLPSDFVSRRLRFDYLKGDYGPLLVLVDCTDMHELVREDFFMASRDRIRRNETYEILQGRLAQELRDHPGLQEVNQRRRQKEMEKHLGEESDAATFQDLINSDPSLASLFSGGDRLATATGPGPQPPYAGRRFPTFFQLSSKPDGGLVKPCPVNRTCRIEFETDAANDYFWRADSPGRLTVDPPNLSEHSRLWNGRFEMRLRVPWDAQIGDLVDVTVTLTDPDREVRGGPFVSRFQLRAEPEANDAPKPGGRNKARNPIPKGRDRGVSLSLPKIVEVRKSEWDRYGFASHESLQIKQDGQGGYDCFINIDNSFLLTELSRARPEQRPLIKHQFKLGVVLSAIGMIKQQEEPIPATVNGRNGASAQDEDEQEGLEAIERYCNGIDLPPFAGPRIMRILLSS